MSSTSQPNFLSSAISPEEAVRRIALARNAILNEMQKVVLGQEGLVESLLISLLSHGHCLLVGRPGMSRSRTLAAFAQVVHLKYGHALLTSDATPDDLTGYELREAPAEGGEAAIRLVRGPLFNGLLVAEDLDRAPRRVQARLLDAMHRRLVSLAGRTYQLPEPFMAAAIVNDIDDQQESPLLQTQLDHFMISHRADYPSQEDERTLVRHNTQAVKPEIRVVLRPRDIVWIQDIVRQIPATDHIVDFAVDLTRATRPTENGVPDFVKAYVDWGAGPRASEQLVMAAKSRALLRGRHVVHAADVKAVAAAVLSHRVFVNREAQRKGLSAEQIVEKLSGVIRERSYGEEQPPSLIVVGRRAATPQSQPPYAAPYATPIASNPWPSDDGAGSPPTL